ncbi:unnamed protein product, partial [Staurois parvus]
MRCPWYLFHRLFCVWARSQGPHDPLLPGGPMSCQSTPASTTYFDKIWAFFILLKACRQEGVP